MGRKRTLYSYVIKPERLWMDIILSVLKSLKENSSDNIHKKEEEGKKRKMLYSIELREGMRVVKWIALHFFSSLVRQRKKSYAKIH